MKVTDEALDKVVTIFANNLGGKVFDGINWTFVLDTDTLVLQEYETIRQELKDMGYNHGEILRAYKAPNGLIYDIDAAVIKSLVQKTMIGSENEGLCKELIESAYEARRNAEMSKLHVYLVKAYKAGNKRVSLALFNTNKGNRITYNTLIENGTYANKKMEIKLPAFALRHWDLEELNRNYLIPARVKIQKVQLVEILPTKTGVGFNFELVGLEE